jgi:IclR family acetate operon transcriptional repressor
MHRVLGILHEENFISRSPISLRYFLGPATRNLAERNISTTGGMPAFSKRIRRLSEETGETVFLTELQGSEALCVALVEGTYPLRLFVRLGQSMPFNAAAAARVLLAYLDDGAARQLLESQKLPEFRAATPHTVDEVMARLERVREKGFDVADDELDAGVWAAAAPIFTSTGRVAASLTVAGSAGRLGNDEAKARMLELLTRAATEMSEELGASNPNSL